MKKTLVIGASTNPVRYSNIAIHRLIQHGFKVVAYGLKTGDVGGVNITTELPDDNIHTVTMYVGANRQSEYEDYIIKLNPKRVIFNPGTENQDFQSKLDAAGIANENSCTLVLLSLNSY